MQVHYPPVCPLFNRDIFTRSDISKYFFEHIEGEPIVNSQTRLPIEMTDAITMNAVTEHCDRTGHDMTMAAVIAMGVQNIACHAGVMVEAPGHSAMPIGQFIEIVAPSGFGKTSIMSAMSTGLRRFAGEEYDCARSCLQADLTEPPAPIVFHSDSTTEEVLDCFRHQTATSIFTSESAMMTDLQHRGPPAAFNDIYSGEGIRQRRIGRAAVNQPHAKLAILSTTQPDPFVDAFEKNNGVAKVNGYSGRCFYAMPVLSGTHKAFESGTKTTPHLDAYNTRIYEALKITQREKRMVNIKLDARAQELWFEHRRWCEAMRTAGHWGGYRQAWLMRLPEKVLRLAGQFRFSESLDGSDIDALSMHRAIAWGHWFADEYLRLFGPLGVLTREVRDAENAWQLLVDHVTTFRDFNPIDQKMIGHLCQDKLKTKARIQKALQVLVHYRRLFPVQVGKNLVFQIHGSVIDSAMLPKWQVPFNPQLNLGNAQQWQVGCV